MGLYTGNPVADAVEHINWLDKQAIDYEHSCNGCGEGFDHGHGVKIDDEKFCNQCIDDNKHLEFYVEAGLTALQILEVTSREINL